MKRNSFFNQFCVLISGLLVLQSCSDTKVIGEREEIFSSVSHAVSLKNSVAVIDDAVRVSDWVIDGGSLSNACKNISVNNPDNNYKLSRKWSADIGRFGRKFEYVSAPIVFDGKVFALSKSGELFVFDFQSGRKIFSKNLMSDDFSSSDIVSYSGVGIDKESGLVFAGLPDGQVVAVSIVDDNPEIRWSQKLNYAPANAPIIYGDVVIVNTMKNTLYGLDRDSGKVLWNLKTLEEMTTMTKFASVAVSDGKVFVAMSNLEIYVVEAKTGKVLFADSLIGKYHNVSPLSLVSVISNPVVSEKYGVVYAGNTENLFASVSFKDNQFKNVIEMPFGTHSMPCLNNDTLFVVTNLNKLVAVKVNDGSVIWEVDLKNGDDFYVVGVLMVNGSLIINTSSGDAITVDAVTGKILTRQGLASKFISAMIAVDDSIIAIDGSGDIVVYEYK